ncbi:hypothetical protein DPMN_122888 [Dreissena polymorpha]|uniref:Uncharacterized protein n=1 Tax=Dreissena polymorpha TaxID=45954 RepID=A0A9D4GSN9_DREPO|nr:hypothetical protein DPMN_122888 [Dreissena polymorpha]
MKPREALVCQSWLDHSELSSEDPSAQHNVLNLSGIRDLHATYGAMKMINCSQCGMCYLALKQMHIIVYESLKLANTFHCQTLFFCKL